MEKKFFEYNILLNRTMNDPELAKEILDDFISETPDLIKKLEEAIKSKDISSVVSIAHEIKGSSATIAADELSKISKQIEFQGRENELSKSKTSINELKKIYKQTVNLIEEEVI